MAMRIAFTGTGLMGEPMARNLLRAGFEVVAYNRSQEKLAGLQAAGAVASASPAAAVEQADCAILMLTGPEALDAVLFGPSGIVEGAAAGTTVVNMSTVPPEYARSLDARLSQHGLVLVDAPVSGSRKPAETGDLVVLASGPADRVDALESVFLAMGKQVVRCGDTGMGSAMKMTANLLLGIMAAGFSEALCYGRQCGLDTDVILNTLLAGPMSCQLYALKEPMYRSGEFSPQFTLKNIVKDLRFILQTADSQGAPALLGNTAFQLFRAALGKGEGENDFAAVIKAMESLCDTTSY